MGRGLSKDSCPLCGASPCNQRYKRRLHVHPATVDYAAEMNPVDGFLCPQCGKAFRVGMLKSDGYYIVDWQTEWEFAPRFCPNCGKDLKGSTAYLDDEKAVER